MFSSNVGFLVPSQMWSFWFCLAGLVHTLSLSPNQKESKSTQFWMPHVSPKVSSVSDPLFWFKLLKKSPWKTKIENAIRARVLKIKTSCLELCCFINERRCHQFISNSQIFNFFLSGTYDVSPKVSSVSEPLLWLKLWGFLGHSKMHQFWFLLSGTIHCPSVCPHTQSN